MAAKAAEAAAAAQEKQRLADEKAANKRAKEEAERDAALKGPFYEAFDDVMEGFAEIYRVTTSTGTACVHFSRKSIYPVKEFVKSWTGGHSKASAQTTRTQDGIDPGRSFAMG